MNRQCLNSLTQPNLNKDTTWCQRKYAQLCWCFDSGAFQDGISTKFKACLLFQSGSLLFRRCVWFWLERVTFHNAFREGKLFSIDISDDNFLGAISLCSCRGKTADSASSLDNDILTRTYISETNTMNRDAQRLNKNGFVQADRFGKFISKIFGDLEEARECSVGRGWICSKLHLTAEIVPAGLAVSAALAWETWFDSHSVTWL